MVKAPVAGRVKTRLGRDIGAVAAVWWYRHQLRRLLRRLPDPRWDLVLAVTPDRKARVWRGAPPHPSPTKGEGGVSACNAAPAGFRGSPPPRGEGLGVGGAFGTVRNRCRPPAVPQGGGDLGDRMLRLIAGMPPGPVLIVGSDVPGLSRRHIARAFRALGGAEAVFGPAPDGGYWAFGASRLRPFRPGALARVRWSGEHALSDTLLALSDRRIAFADTLADVDTAEDLRLAGGGGAC